MNPVLILYAIITIIIFWILSAFLFPKIGEFVIDILEAVNNILKGEEDEE